MCIFILLYYLQDVYLLFYYYFIIIQYISKSFKDFIPNENIVLIETKNIEKQKNNNKEKELIEENIKLKKKIKDLENIIIKLKDENKILNNKLNDYNILKQKIKNLENEINNKNKEIQNYILQIKNINENKNEITSINPGEKIVSVLFMTQGNQDILNYSMACKNTDLFVRLEERLYNDFPKYKNYNTFFKVDVNGILRFKTIEENGIKNNDIISVFFEEED